MKVLVIFVGLVALSLGKDLTLKKNKVGRGVVEAVVDKIQQSCVFSDDKQMLRRIAKVESDDGKADHTFVHNGNAYYGGIWQVRKVKFDDTQDRTDLFEKIEAKFGIKWSTVTWEDLVKPLYSGLAARIWMDTFPSKHNEIDWNENKQAAWWVSSYRKWMDDKRPEMYTDAIISLDEKCDVPKADIVFVLDGSGSIGAGNFVTMLKFVADVVEAFDVSENGVRIGVIQYSSNTKEEFYLGQITDKIQVKTEVQRVNYLRGSTNTAAALDDMKKMFDQYGRGAGTPQIGVVMTDGRSTDPSKTKIAAGKVHVANLTTFGIGVTGGVELSELRAIATDPDCIHMHLLASFSDISPFTSKIKNQACKAPAELLPGQEVDGTVKTGRRIFFKIRIKRNKKGVHFKLKMRSGGSILFISYKARNPSQALYDFGLTVNSAIKNGAFVNIPFPGQDIVEDTVNEIDAFAALLGDGIGQPNNYTMSLVEGLASGGRALTPTLFVAFIAAILGLFVRV